MLSMKDSFLLSSHYMNMVENVYVLEVYNQDRKKKICYSCVITKAYFYSLPLYSLACHVYNELDINRVRFQGCECGVIKYHNGLLYQSLHF